MKYQANSVIVEAFQIISIGAYGGQVLLEFEEYDLYDLYEPSLEMLARMIPEIGDYLVIQEDGYTYLNPKEVFERKYSKMEEL